jgi:hypothetical protein
MGAGYPWNWRGWIFRTARRTRNLGRANRARDQRVHPLARLEKPGYLFDRERGRPNEPWRLRGAIKDKFRGGAGAGQIVWAGSCHRKGHESRTITAGPPSRSGTSKIAGRASD